MDVEDEGNAPAKQLASGVPPSGLPPPGAAPAAAAPAERDGHYTSSSSRSSGAGADAAAGAAATAGGKGDGAALGRPRSHAGAAGQPVVLRVEVASAALARLLTWAVWALNTVLIWVALSLLSLREVDFWQSGQVRKRCRGGGGGGHALPPLESCWLRARLNANTNTAAQQLSWAHHTAGDGPSPLPTPLD